MTSALRRPDPVDRDHRDSGDAPIFEVATEASDTMRATLLVRGALTATTVAVLSSAVSTNLRAGRRYLRLDLSAVPSIGPRAVAALARSIATTRELGGRFTCTASDEIAEQLRVAGLELS